MFCELSACNTNKKIDIAKELKVVDLTAGGKIQPYVKGLQVENELNKVLRASSLLTKIHV